MTPADFIWCCVNENKVDDVRQALSAQPELANSRDGKLGTTPLHCAAHRGFTDIVEALLASGSDLHALERVSGTTPLHWAAEGGHLAIARMLVEGGASLNGIDEWYGLTPLGWATVVCWNPDSWEDRPATAAYLLAAGAQIDIFSAVASENEAAIRSLATGDQVLRQHLRFAGDGMQPLHLAVARQLPAIASLLLDLGADLSARTASGLTALALAATKRDEPMAALLRARGATDDLSSAIAAGDVDAAASHARAAVADELTRLLFHAVLVDNAPIIRVLARNGADPNGRMRYLIEECPAMATPLHIAAVHGREAATRALLEAGADPNPRNDEGIPAPLHLAAGGGRLEIARALLEHGADRDALESGFNSTALGWAEFGGHTAVVELLRKHE